MQVLKTFAIGLVVVGVALSIGLKVTSSVKTNMVIDTDVTNETHSTNLSKTGFKVVTVNNVGEGVKSNTEELYDPYSSAVLTEGENYTVVSYENGKFNVTNYYEGTTSSKDVAFNYTYEKPDATARTGATDAINGLKELSGFLPIIGLVVAAAAVIGLVSGGFSSGRRRRRGRA